MRISVTKFGGAGELLTIEIASDMTIADLKAIIESESDFGIQSNQMNLYHDGKHVDKNNPNVEIQLILGKMLLDDNQTLEQANIKDYDMVTCLQKPCMFFFNEDNRRC